MQRSDIDSRPLPRHGCSGFTGPGPSLACRDKMVTALKRVKSVKKREWRPPRWQGRWAHMCWGCAESPVLLAVQALRASTGTRATARSPSRCGGGRRSGRAVQREAGGPAAGGPANSTAPLAGVWGRGGSGIQRLWQQHQSITWGSKSVARQARGEVWAWLVARPERGRLRAAPQESWRRPKGIDSRVRRKFKGCGVIMPNIGYGTNKKTRHQLPNGARRRGRGGAGRARTCGTVCGQRSLRPLSEAIRRRWREAELVAWRGGQAERRLASRREAAGTARRRWGRPAEAKASSGAAL